MTRRLLPWTILLSVALHGAAVASLSAAPGRSSSDRPRKAQLRFDVVESPRAQPQDPPPEPPKPLPPPRKPSPSPPRSLPQAAAPKAPEPEDPAPVNPGVTLAGESSGNAFSMPLGSGGALDPTRLTAPAPLNTPPPSPRPPTSAPEPRLVAVGDLSSRPAPPSLGAALERNYPPQARSQGQSGSAKVRARIDPDGVVRRVALIEESSAGFGTACTRTLSGSRWAAPKDKAGHPVATEIRYTCRFVVNP